MHLIDNANKVLENYDHKKFHDNLEKELNRRGLKKRAFCEKIGKPSNWIGRRLDYKPEFSVLIRMQELGYDILKLAGIESTQKIKIPHEQKNKEFVIIKGEKIQLNIIHYKVRVILSHPPENIALINTINSYYDLIQERLDFLKKETI